MWATALSHKLVIHHMSAVPLPPAPSYCAKCRCSVQTDSFQAEQCELHWGSVLERLSPAATFWISNTTTPVRAWWSLSEAETKPWARLQQTHGTEKHIGEVWCLLSHLKNTSSCTRLVKIDINSRTGGREGWDRELHSYEGIPISPYSYFQCRMSTE